MADVARADQLRALRRQHRKTQPEMADLAGISLRAYQDWERLDKPGGVNFDNVKRLANHLGVDPEGLVHRRDEDPDLLDSQELRSQLDRIEQHQAQVLEEVAGLREQLDATQALGWDQAEELSTRLHALEETVAQASERTPDQQDPPPPQAP